jgi:proteasome lid subunit RPN8/RPN11
MDTAHEFVQAATTLMETASVEMTDHRDEVYPNEAVGILCSDGSCFPLINQARSAHRLEVSAMLVGEAIDMLIERGLSPVAFYHSHPTSASGPSSRDIQMMQTKPGALFVIVGQDGIAGWLWDEALESAGRIPLPERSGHVEHD